MTKNPRIIILLGLAALGLTSYSLVSQGTGDEQRLPAPWLHQDVGRPDAPGDCRTAGSEFELTAGAGTDDARSSTSDEIHFMYRPWSGDGVIVARVVAITGSNPWDGVGLMVRSNLDPGSQHALFTLSTARGMAFRYRLEAEGRVQTIPYPVSPLADPDHQQVQSARLRVTRVQRADRVATTAVPRWLKLVRQGDVFTGYNSPDGIAWQWVFTERIPMPRETFVGLAVAGHGNGCTVRVDQVSVDVPALTVKPRPVGQGKGLQATFKYPTQTEAIQSISPTINFVWAPKQPLNQPPKEARWEGFVEALEGEPYVFLVRHDGGVRFWVDGKLLIDDPGQSGVREARAVVTLAARQKYPIQLEFLYVTNKGVVNLLWSSPSTPRQIIPSSQLYTPTHPAVQPGGEAQSAPSGITNDLSADLDALRTVDRLSTLPLPWLSRTFGGQNNQDEVQMVGGAFVVAGSGTIAELGSDQGRYVYQPWVGDVEVVARISRESQSNALARVGLMIRENLRDESVTAFLGINGEGGSRLHYRRQPGARATFAGPSLPIQPWVKLVRRGDNFSAYNSADGANWIWLGTAWVPMSRQVFVGLAVGSGRQDSSLKAIFEQVNLRDPAALPAPIVGSGDGLGAVYWDQSITNRVERVDPRVNFIWGYEAPAEGINAEKFQVRWEGLVEAQYSEPYSISVRSDGDMQLWWDGKLVLEAANGSSIRTRRVKLPLLAGHRYAIRLVYSNLKDYAETRLLWSSPSTGEGPIPASQLYSTHNLAYDEVPDKDHDGMPDRWELAQGLDPLQATDATTDLDEDGLTNLEEYQAGTDPHKSDSDGDGLPDGWEVNHRLSPSEATDATRDGDHDGLTNLEEYQAGTNPGNADTDGDGMSDGMEIKEMVTNPLQSDTQPVKTVFEVPGIAAIAQAGKWAGSGPGIHALDERGWLEYLVTAPQADMYRLEIAGESHSPHDASPEFDLLLWVDGEYLGRSVLQVGADRKGVAHQWTPWLKAGEHRIRVFWDNAIWNRSFELSALRLQTLPGPDTNGDGIKDWASIRLQKLCGVESASGESFISPACLEGRGGYLSMMNLTGGIDPQPGAGNRWYANVPLSATNVTTVICSFQNDGLRGTNQILWRPTNLLEASNLVIRVGDALLLEARPVGTEEGQMQITVAGITNYAASPAQPLAHRFDRAGDFSVTGKFIASGGATQSRTISVKVIAADLGPSPAAWTGKWRPWECVVGEDRILQADPRLKLEFQPLLTSAAGAARYMMATDASEDQGIVSRIGTNGPVLGHVLTEGFRLYSGLETAIRLVEHYTDGSELVEMGLVLSPVRSQVTIRIELLVGGAIFEDGTVVLDLTPADFDELGRTNVRFLRAKDFKTSVCHRTKVYQGDTCLGVYP